MVIKSSQNFILNFQEFSRTHSKPPGVSKKRTHSKNSSRGINSDKNFIVQRFPLYS